ncbi:hypothetical protein [Vogesella sp. LIG4]|uniref:hypothetical protein n=1 Tax=Vogesella sp. LIG4 TaxID=1192162 RepID=UPI00081FD43F|nr:hypothetical protein [Vogesella sp. LIG4]SCK11391.1 hypothetical protein PSELUDRAFT_0952 [Vogesella sp. LIG4]
MNRLFPTLLFCVAASLGGEAALARPLFFGPPSGFAQQDRVDSLRLRELRLKEAIDRGELSPEEADRLRQHYRQHELLRPNLQPGPASEPAHSPQKEWRRWRKNQDRLNAAPFTAPD